MLQGSLENFALDEVLGLLSGTSKTGQLEIAGNRGTGTLVFHDGRLINGTASFTANGTELEDVMFELLRYGDGTFTFSLRDVEPGETVENVSTVLANAEARLQDWRSIEAVVPSLNHQVVPVLELPSDEVTVSRDEWATLMTIGTGCPGSHVCDRLTLGEVEGSRRIKDLAERMLVNVTEPIGSYRRSQAARTEPATNGATGTTATATAAPASAPVATAPVAPAKPAAPQPVSADTAKSLEALASADGSGPALGSVMADRPQSTPAPAAP
ncbi:MAG: DUF4388 domain-containing protein, partial [Actinomycetota bacterium]